MKKRPRADDRSPSRASMPSSDATEYGERTPFQAARPEPPLTRAMPVAGDLSCYRAPTARRDLVAGVTVAALAIPSAMAYAEVPGFRP